MLSLPLRTGAFRDTVAAIEVVERKRINRARHRYYTPTWEPFPDPMHVGMPRERVVRDPPRCLEQLLGHAAKLGSALGTYWRLDFFATERGWVFNEFTHLPFGGRNFTPYCDELFGALWAGKFPNAI